MHRWALIVAVSAPLASVGVVSCTTSGLDALGEGSADAGGPSDTGAPPSATLDTGTDTSSVVNPPVDSSTPPVDSSPSQVQDSSAGPPDTGGTTAPASALPIWLDAGTASWCDTHTGFDFCADFDEVPLPAGFGASDGAFLAQTSSRPSSGPNDLLLYVPPQGGTGTWGSKLSREFTTVASTLTYAFDIDPELLNATASGVLFAALDFQGNANAKYSVRLAYNEGLPRVEESFLGSPSDIYHSNFVIPLSAWSRVEVVLSFPPSGDGGADAEAAVSSESVYVNGVLQGSTEVLSPPAGFDPRPNLLLGAVYGTSPTNGWAIRYDNVTLNLQ